VERVEAAEGAGASAETDSEAEEKGSAERDSEAEAKGSAGAVAPAVVAAAGAQAEN
jgi:hypothetical protein